MAGTPLGIGLAIDFGKLDADLSKVTEKIEQAGSRATLRVGTLSGMSKGDMGGQEVADKFEMVGARLSQGIAAGVQNGGAIMLAFASRINGTLERLTATTVSMFGRIDSAMKFPMWDTAMTKMHASLQNVWKPDMGPVKRFFSPLLDGFRKFFVTGKQSMSTLDMAMAGGFGKIAQTATKILMPLFADLGKLMAAEMTKEIDSLIPVVQEVARAMSAAMAKAAASMSMSMTTVVDTISAKFKGLGAARHATEANAAMLVAGTSKPYRPPYGGFPAEKEDRRKSFNIGNRFEAQKAYFERQPGFVGPPAPPQAPPQQFGHGLGGMGVQVDASLSGAVQQIRDFNRFVKESGGLIATINQQFGIMGRVVTVPVQAVGFLSRTVFGTAAAFLDFGTIVARTYNRIRFFVTSFGAIHKQTYSGIFADHNLFVAGVMGTIKTLQHLKNGLVDLVTLRAFRRVGDDAKNAGSSIAATTGIIGKMTSSIGRLGVEMLAAFGVVGVVYKLVEFFKKGVQGAAALNETVNVSRSVFGASFGTLEAQADKLSEKYGVLRNETMQVQAGFGAMAQGAGMSEAKTASFAESMTARTIDFAREWQLSFADAADAIKSGLGGQGRALKEYGVFIDDDAVKADALAKGMGGVAVAAGKAHRQLSTHAKVSNSPHGFSTIDKVGTAPRASGGHAKLQVDMAKSAEVAARADIIMKGLAYTEGALERTSAGASAQFKKAGGGVSEFATRVGQMLLPAVAAGAEGLNLLLGGVLDLVQKGAPMISAWSESAAGAVKGVIGAIQDFGPKVVSGLTWAWEQARKGPLGFVNVALEKIYEFGSAIPQAIGIGIRNAGTLWEIATLEVGEFAENAVRRGSWLGENLSTIWAWIGRNWANMLSDMLQTFQVGGSNLLVNAGNLGEAIIRKLGGKKDWEFAWTPLLDGFKAITEKFPETIAPALVDVSAKVKELYAKIGAKETREFVGPPAPKGPPPGPKKPGEAMEPPKAAEYKLATAVEIGSKEAYSIIARSQVSGRPGDPARENVKAVRDGNVILQQIATNTGKAQAGAVKVVVK